MYDDYEQWVCDNVVFTRRSNKGKRCDNGQRQYNQYWFWVEGVADYEAYHGRLPVDLAELQADMNSGLPN